MAKAVTAAAAAINMTLIERPFVEGKAIAGTEKHRKIIIENLRRLFKK